MFDLNFSAMETSCCSAMHAHFTYCVVRARLDVSPRREATSRSTNIFRELFQVVYRIVTKSACVCVRNAYGKVFRVDACSELSADI